MKRTGVPAREFMLTGSLMIVALMRMFAQREIDWGSGVGSCTWVDGWASIRRMLVPHALFPE